MFSKILATKSSISTKKLPFITFLPCFFQTRKKNSKPKGLEFKKISDRERDSSNAGQAAKTSGEESARKD